MNSEFKWKDLKWWKSGEKQVIDEKLADLTRAGTVWHPAKQDIYAALDATPYDQVRVCMIGQDPYPGGPPPWLESSTTRYATGLAFSISRDLPRECWPPTLKNLLEEYTTDLKMSMPDRGDLSWWARNGVLLWNMYPTCTEGKPGSHHWCEYDELTKEILLELDKKPIVFILLGSKAKQLVKYITYSKTILTSHPSPLGVDKGFKGSKIFSTTNSYLVELGLEPINWKLWSKEKIDE